MLDQLNDYDWAEVFAAAGEKQRWGTNNPVNISASLGYTGSVEPFTREDVAEVLAMSDGQNDGDSWLVAVRLHDGRFAYLEGWCDYTGWDCQSGCSCMLAATREDLITYALTDEARERLRLVA